MGRSYNGGMERRILIVETGQPVASMRRHGGFPHWIRHAAGVHHRGFDVVDVERGAAPPAPGRHAAVIVTGSAAMVTDRHGWSERSADWLRGVVGSGMPVLGICYGHQLLAHAFGGEVGPNPRGREMGTVAIELHAEAADDPLFRGLPRRFAAHATHLQSVLRPPDGAVLLAANAHDPAHALRIGDRAWGVQFHPEFSVAHMRGYIAARAEALRGEGADPAARIGAVRAAPVARTVLRRFVQLAHRGAGAFG